MVLGDLMASRFSQSYVAVSNYLDECSNAEEVSTATSIAYLDRTIVLCDLRHEAFEGCVPSGPFDSGLVSKWRLKDRMKTGCVAIVLCLNISVDTPDVIKISPCARMECWIALVGKITRTEACTCNLVIYIMRMAKCAVFLCFIDPTTMATQKALETIGKTLTLQYERWQPRACYKIQLDPTVEEVRKLCSTCRKYAKSERVLFHYNGHGVPMPTANGEIWLFNKLQDCSTSCGSSMRDCILLAACETLPQNAEFPADVFTSCLTTPIKMALRWFCTRSLLRESLDYSLID